jgi:MFS family permease
MPSSPSPRLATNVVLHIPGFRLLCLVTVVIQLTFGMMQVILGWVVLGLTGSSQMVGVAFALRAAPNLLVGFVAGAVTDRLDRRLVMRCSTFGMALLSLMMAWGLWQDRVALWHVLGYAALIGTLRVFEMAARQAYVYDIVGAQNIIQGMALSATAQRIGGTLGALIAGVTLEWWGASAAFLSMGLCYGAGGILLFVLRIRGVAAPTASEALWQNIKTYARALRSDRMLRSLIASTAAAEILGFSHQAILPVLANDVLQVGAAGLGVLTAFRFVGGILGALLMTALGRTPYRGMLLLIVQGLFGIGLAMLAHATQLWSAVAWVTVINVTAMATDILHQTLLQTHVANTQRGRAMGLWIIGTGAAPIGNLEIGYLTGATSVSSALSLNGSALILLPFLLAWLIPQLRRL